MNVHDTPSTTKTRRMGGLRQSLVLAVAVVLCAAVVPLALPDREGVGRADARDSSDLLPAWATAQLDGAGSRAAPAEVTVRTAAGGTAVPRSYLGISTEYWTLPLYVGHMAVLERALALVHAYGDGPLIIRIGGDSADHSFWQPTARRLPRWTFSVTPAWLNQVRSIVDRGGVRLILDLNLVTGSPGAAATWARVARAGLPPRAIAGLEIGNEPDIYNRWNWLATLSETKLRGGLLPADISALAYTHDFHIYANALARGAPGLPLIGPALSAPVLNSGWFRSLIAHERRRLAMLSAHRYPLSACVRPSSRQYPTIGRLLGERASTGVASPLGPVIRLAHHAGLPLRLTELNSVTCGGVSGMSDSFATGLWAPDVLFELLRAGVDGVNIHVRGYPINAAFAFDSRGLVARPLLYGMTMFARTLGAGAHLLPVHSAGAASLGLKVWVVRVRGGMLHVLVIDKGNRNARVLLRLPAIGPATVERLLAPSAASRSKVLLGGQWLGRQGQWLGKPYLETIRPGSRGYVLLVPRHTAALLRVGLRPTTPRHATAATQRHRRRLAARVTPRRRRLAGTRSHTSRHA